MTRFTPKFSVCRVLITASAIWLALIMCFYYSWNPEYLEKSEFMEVRDESYQSRTAKIKFKVEEKSEIGTKDLRRLQTKFKKRTKAFNYKNLVTPVSPELLQKLGLQKPGENGSAVILQDVDSEIQVKIDEGWKRHQFNEFVSDLISVRRTLPDPREAYCKRHGLYLENLPSTSVIVIFHNEAWSTLLRTVHSILDRSPEHLIKEVILVDDFSNMPHLKKPLEQYMAQLPKVKILRADKREGLIKARLRGAVVAKGETLTFLDSHVECTDGWLEPLLDRIARDSTTVVCPVIDIIEDNTLEFTYQSSEGLQVGGFDWFLIFDWHMVPPNEVKRKNHTAEPTKSPTMAGGLFSIDTKFFKTLGMYDPDFDIWGGENLELSFKTWMCGGTLEIIPCSHVGHIFRKISPYSWRPGVDVLRKNLVRLAEVWLDDYAQIYYLRSGKDKGDFGDISERVKLRQDLKCKSFQWYIDNVYPEIDIPDNFGEGSVVNLGTGNSSCLDADVNENDEKGSITLYSCHFLGGNQFFEFTKDREVRKNLHCIDYNEVDPNSLELRKCHGGKGNQDWMYDLNSNQLIHQPSKKCLSVEMESKKIIIDACDETNHHQKWKFEYLYREKFTTE